MEYFPPECVGGALEIENCYEPMIGPAFDTYALGIIAYQLLTRNVFPPTSHEVS